jgi:hypothetical protein
MVTLRTALAALLLASAAHSSAAAQKTPALPEDLAPDSIDVSGYPAEMKRTYNDILLPFAAFQGGARRFLYSPMIDEEEWKKLVGKLYRMPPCCGACPILKREEARSLWRFLAYDSNIRKTGPKGPAWLKDRRALIDRFKTEFPEEYRQWLDTQPQDPALRP